MNDLIDPAGKNHESGASLYLGNVFGALWKKRLFLAAVFVIFGILGIIVSLISPITYLAQTVIIPPISDNGGGGLSLAGDLPFDLSSSLFGAINTDEKMVERYILIMQSDRLRVAVIDSFRLAHRYGFDRKKKPYFIEDVIDVFAKKAQLFSNKGTALLMVSDRSPDTAAAIANFMACMLDSINKDISRSHMGRKKEFLYRRMCENRDSLTLCEEQFVAYQKKHGIINIEKQAEASVSAITRTETDILLKELQLSLDESKFLMSSASIAEQRNDIRALREKLMNLGGKTDKTLFLPIKNIPDEALTFARMQRSIAIMEVLDKYLTKAYEEARLEERSTIPTIGILDPARVPQKRFAPKRKKIILLFLGVGLGIGIFLVMMRDLLEPKKHSARPLAT